MVLLLLITLFSGLMAGLFFAWSVSVMPGLGRLPDAGFLSAMQAMNRAIQNPAFFLVFMGILALLPATAFLHRANADRSLFWLLVAATAVYFIGVFGVTAAGNIPLNNALDSLNIPASTATELQAFRARFEGRWNLLNTVRTLASLATFILLVLACLRFRRELAGV